MTEVNISSKIGSIRLGAPFFNASGVWCTTREQLLDVAKSESGAVMFKSMTILARKGNEEPRYYSGTGFSVNSMGLPNLGVDYYCEIVDEIRAFRKPVFASIAGFTPQEFETLCKRVSKKNFDGIEVNLSCPNLEGKGIFAYDIGLSIRILRRLRRLTNKTLGVKIPPYTNREDIQKLSAGLIENGIEFVTAINSYPLGSDINSLTGKKIIKPNGGIGGLGGSVIFPMAMAQVMLFSQFGKGKFSIIGVGGIHTGEDIYKYFLAGASAVQVGTYLHENNPLIFCRLKNQMIGLLKKKKINSLSSKIGRVIAVK